MYSVPVILLSISVHHTCSSILTGPVLEHGGWSGKTDNEEGAGGSKQPYQAVSGYTYGGPPVHPTDCYIETGCSTSCGAGFRLLVPHSQAVGCGQLVLQVLPCNERTCPVDCTWDQWTAWSQCAQRVKRQAGYGSPSLDGANTVCSQSRARVIRKAPLNGGRQCRGESIEERYCTSADCTGRLLHVDYAQEQIV